MSAFRSGIFTTGLADRIGFGVTLNADGSIATEDGPTLERTVAAPTAARNAGSLALRTNGTLYSTTGGGVWFPIGGGGSGWQLPDDIQGIWGTAAPGQVTSVYVSASNRWDLSGDSISQATAASGADMRIETGQNVITGAAAGNASGSLTVRTGATDSTNAGGTGGNSGALNFQTGNSTSTLGTSGATGAITIQTGNSDDGNSGTIALTTGTAGGTRGVIDINAPQVTFDTQATSFVLIDANAAALSIGAAGATNMLVFDTSNGAEEIVLNAVGGLRAVDNVGHEVGSAVNDIFSFSYQLGSTQGQIGGTSITAGGAAQATRPFQLFTGNRTKNDADAGTPGTGGITISTGSATVALVAGGATGGASGAIILATGATDSLLGGNTAGNSGDLNLITGACQSTLGTSGQSGAILVDTGDSADAATGSVTISTGNAAGAAGDSGSINLTPGTSANGVRGQVVALGLRTTSASAEAIVGARVLTFADSGAVFSVSQGAAYDIDLPNPTIGSGLSYRFVLGTAAANNVTITVAGGAATFIGTIVNDITSVIPATGNTLTFVSGTAALGDNIEIWSISNTLYFVRAVTSTAGGITIA